MMPLCGYFTGCAAYCGHCALACPSASLLAKRTTKCNPPQTTSKSDECGAGGGTTEPFDNLWDNPIDKAIWNDWPLDGSLGPQPDGSYGDTRQSYGVAIQMSGTPRIDDRRLPGDLPVGRSI